MTRFRPLVAALVLLAWSPALHADMFNQRNHLVGERASMMGGAYTALGEDLSAAFYNPAGLPYVEGVGLSFSISGYSYQRFMMTEIYGTTQDLVYNVRMSRFNPLPSTLAFSYAPFERRWVICIGAFETDRLRFAYGPRGRRFGIGVNVMGGRSRAQVSPGGDVPVRWDRLQVQIVIGGTTDLLK